MYLSLSLSLSHTHTHIHTHTRTRGFAEVKKLFGALKAASPQTLDWQLGEVTDGKVEIRLWQHYTIGSRDVKLFEKVIVEHDNGKITSMEDRWRGKPLRQYPPFTWCRGLNGLIGDSLLSDVKEEEDAQSKPSPADNGTH